jgi:ribose transport system permease protein
MKNIQRHLTTINSKVKFIEWRAVIKWLSNSYILLVFLILIITGSILSPNFFTVTNFRNVSLQLSMTSIVAIGMLFTVITGGIDLSVGSVVALAGCIVAGFTQQGMSPIVAIISVLLLMSIAGLISGLLVSKGRVAPFISTLATMTIWRGAAYIYQVGQDRRIDGTQFVNVMTAQIGPIPFPVIILAVVALFAGFLLSRTAFGRSMYAVGGNREAARLAGINVDFTLVLVYVFCAVLSGLSGIILAARLALGTALVGQGYELDAIAAVVVGGASMTGGVGTVFNTLLGAFIIGFLNNILNLMGVAAYPQMIIKGIIIVAAVIWKRAKR